MFIQTNQDVFTLLDIKGTKPQEPCLMGLCVYTKWSEINTHPFDELRFLISPFTWSIQLISLLIIYIIYTHSALILISLSLYIFLFLNCVSNSSFCQCVELLSVLGHHFVFILHIYFLINGKKPTICFCRQITHRLRDWYLFIYYFFFQF